MGIIYFFICTLGVIVGSFVNVLIYRLPRQEGFVRGRSKCPHCHEILKWYDLIPLLSFLILKGKCRNCGKKISWSYFWVELFSGLIFIFSFIYLSPMGIFYWLGYLFVLELFLILFVTDIKELILPDSVILSGIVVVVIMGFAEKMELIAPVFNSLSLNHIGTAIIFFLLFFSVWFLSRGQWLGLGDGKLMLLVGLIFGAIESLLIFYMAVVLGTLVAVIMLFFRKANLRTKLPLGAFICLSAMVYIFWGHDIMSKVDSLNLFLEVFK